MWYLHIIFILFVLSIINIFQLAAAVLAKQIRRSFWRWYWIAQFLPGISLIVLMFLWNLDVSAETTEP
nr:phosphoglycerol transferase MdoB-like AlkP superfamily enzyme [Mucilaginibacter sp. X4EP1]